MPQRVNRAIELLEQSQPIYYTGVGDVSYEGGKASAGTWADYLALDMEHGAFDMMALSEFMRGLADGGPTRSGHRTPAVVITLPTGGPSEAVVRANAWMFQQALARGVHGVMMCHAESPEAVRAFVESCRYPFAQAEAGGRVGVGRRGAGGQATAADIWGVPVGEYLAKADPWPLNANGELLLGLKIENERALANAEESAAVPGVAIAEWGPGDMGMSLGFPDAHDAPYPESMQAARSRVMTACKDAGVFFLNAVSSDNITQMIDEGVMVCASGRGGEEAAIKGRAHTRREMPV